jgi:hypothetical protein
LFGFWRYQLILVLLFILWGQFFTAGTIYEQIVFNFAVFYPIGLLGGYRKEKKLYLYGAVLVFDCLTYLLTFLSGMRIENWLLVPVDFVSLLIFTEVGYFMGKRINTKRK